MHIHENKNMHIHEKLKYMHIHDSIRYFRTRCSIVNIR